MRIPSPRGLRASALAPVALLAAAAACDRTLATQPYTQVPAGQAIVDSATAQAALTGAYAALQTGGGNSYYDLYLELLGDLPSDNARWAGTYQFLGDVAANSMRADNPAVTSLWEGIYVQIDRDNVVLARVPKVAGLSDSAKNGMLGEAYLLRALGFHNLVKFWGDVPTPLTPVASAADAGRFTRTPVAQVYAQILSDLDQAAKLITNTTDTRRATPTAAVALRARVLLYRASLAGNANSAADYQGALDAANAVLAGQDTLTVAYPDLFSATGANTSEDIFRVVFTPSQPNNLGYYWRYDGRHEAAPTTDLDTTYEAGDVRHAWTVQPRSPGSSKLQGTKWPTTTGTEHPHVIRLAELVLIKAEVLARQGNLAAAVAEYNKVRVRAGLAPHVLGTDVTTQADVLAAIDKERRLEFALEGDRWPDLVRTGRAGVVKTLANPGYVLFPIPLRDLRTAPGLTQNPGY